MRNLVARTLRTVLRAVEGEYRPGPYYLPVTGGWLPAGSSINWWQEGIIPTGGPTRSAMVEACVSAYSQTVAMCPGDHWRATDKGGRERVTTSALSRVLQSPNDYQSMSDFMLNITRNLYLDGNAYALAIRNDRFEVTELHLMNSWMSLPQIAETGDIFYHMAGNHVVDKLFGVERLIVPQRDVLHIRLHATHRYPYPLVGESPLVSAIADIGLGDAIMTQQLEFYKNQARPSAVLSTDLILDKDQVQFLRDRWEEQTTGLNQGKTPIVTGGLKVQPWGVPGKDTQIADIAKLSLERIALAFRVPLQVLGVQVSGHSYRSAEALMQFWISTGLGFALNHIEEAFGLLFQLRGQPDEYVEFSTDSLLRSDMKDRVAALKDGVLGGIFAPNEARNKEGYDDVPFGDEPRVQQQVVPLSAASAIQPAKPGSTGPHPPPAPGPDAAPAPSAEAPKDYSNDVKRETQRILDNAAKLRRRFN
jgi:HK97 family phage portal protein